VEGCPNESEEALTATLNKILNSNNLHLESSKITLLIQPRDDYRKVAFDA